MLSCSLSQSSKSKFPFPGFQAPAALATLWLLTSTGTQNLLSHGVVLLCRWLALGSCGKAVFSTSRQAAVLLLRPGLCRKTLGCSQLANTYWCNSCRAFGLFFLVFPCPRKSCSCRSEAWAQVAFCQANFQLWICFLVISFQVSDYFLR